MMKAMRTIASNLCFHNINFLPQITPTTPRAENQEIFKQPIQDQYDLKLLNSELQRIIGSHTKTIPKWQRAVKLEILQFSAASSFSEFENCRGDLKGYIQKRNSQMA